MEEEDCCQSGAARCIYTPGVDVKDAKIGREIHRWIHIVRLSSAGSSVVVIWDNYFPFVVP